ncbi:mechanosensitive ion channel family protein [Roseivirga sp. E12]|uniref:mechanosensitive ion channel family protein n=1 Tax=Roseivirga sp. E12 TaxID=2819237 RepID=UPI001ABC2610|nr:mechanosensitive ion channel family protein [Roseivirga sp. E12]MBO3700459.1 mechanosensitive ion channel family protein [Roseivirga sp. E12]
MRSSHFKSFRVYLVLFLTFSAFALSGQEAELPSRFNTPYDAIYNHLQYLQDGSHNEAQAAKSLFSAGRSQGEIEQLAVELKQIFDGSGNYIRLEDLPRTANYFDSLTQKHRYLLTSDFPDIYVQKYGDQWLYSERTVVEIDEIHKQVYPFGTDKLLNLLPKLGNKTYLGLHLWQYLGILILISLGFILHFVLIFLIKAFLVRIMHRYGKIDLARDVLIPAAKPFSLMIVAEFSKILVPTLQLPPFIAANLILVARALVPFFATIFFYKLVDILGLYFERMADKSANTLDDQLVPLIRKILRVFVVIVGIIAILSSIKFDIWPLLTGLSIGGLAFALAAQDTLKNFFGSLMIFIDRPFQIGDWVTSGEIDGTVEEVGFRSTRIRTFRDSVMYVPNSIISNSTVDNHGLRKYRRFYTKLSVTYDSPARLIEVFVKGIEKIVQNHPETRKDYYNIFLNDYAASSLDVMLYIFFEVPDWTAELRCRQEIMLEVNKLAEHLGVRFAFPTQTLMIEQTPGQLSLTPNYKQTEDEMNKELEAYFKGRTKK